MSYWSVKGVDDAIPLYVFAATERAAQMAVEKLVGPFPNGRVKVGRVYPDDLDEYTDVIDEPEDTRAARVDGLSDL